MYRGGYEGSSSRRPVSTAGSRVPLRIKRGLSPRLSKGVSVTNGNGWSKQRAVSGTMASPTVGRSVVRAETEKPQVVMQQQPAQALVENTVLDVRSDSGLLPWTDDASDSHDATVKDFTRHTDFVVFGETDEDPNSNAPGNIDLSQFAGHKVAVAKRYGTATQTKYSQPSPKAVKKRQLYANGRNSFNEEVAKSATNEWNSLMKIVGAMAAPEPKIVPHREVKPSITKEDMTVCSKRSVSPQTTVSLREHTRPSPVVTLPVNGRGSLHTRASPIKQSAVLAAVASLQKQHDTLLNIVDTEGSSTSEIIEICREVLGGVEDALRFVRRKDRRHPSPHHGKSRHR